MTALVSPEWLADHLDLVRVVDVRWYLTEHDRGRAEYDEAHIPGSVHLDLERDLAGMAGPGRHPLPAPEAFAATLGRNGISNTDHVVAYDTGPGTIAARLWWMLRWIGHENVSVLDGGFAAWTEEGRPTESVQHVPESATFVAGTPLTKTIEREELADSLDRVVTLDARAGDRYRGESEPVDPVGGHIPSALSAPTSDNVDASGRFLTPAALRSRFESLGVTDGQPIVNSCGSGVTACHNILALHIAGFAEPVLYPGSWSDWSRSDEPIATGPEPGPARP